MKIEIVVGSPSRRNQSRIARRAILRKREKKNWGKWIHGLVSNPQELVESIAQSNKEKKIKTKVEKFSFIILYTASSPPLYRLITDF